jgi:hypothetical protein
MTNYVLTGVLRRALAYFRTLSVSGNATVGGALTLTGLLTAGSEDAITAFVGGGQASARALTKTVNRISTVASAADSVKLPAATAGLVVVVVNGAAANSMQVFGAGTDTINDVATATGVAQAAGKTAVYACPVAGKWYRALSA